MCRGVVGVPRQLRKLSYNVLSIEFKFKNSKGEAVVPEMVIASTDRKHSLLLEWKEGSNTDSTQLSRYANITAVDLRTQALLPAEVCSNHDVCIVGKQDHFDRLKIGIQDGKFDFPLLSVSLDEIVLSLNKFSEDALNLVFKPGLKVDLNTAPLSFIPFDEKSRNWEIAEVVIPYIIEQMIQHKQYILLNNLCNDLIPDWSIMGPAKQQQLIPKLTEVITEASKNEFKRYLQRNNDMKGRTHTDTWEVRNNPLDLSSTKRSREFKRLRKLHYAFLEALRTGRRPSRQEEFDF